MELEKFQTENKGLILKNESQENELEELKEKETSMNENQVLNEELKYQVSEWEKALKGLKKSNDNLVAQVRECEEKLVLQTNSGEIQGLESKIIELQTKLQEVLKNSNLISSEKDKAVEAH